MVIGARTQKSLGQHQAQHENNKLETA